MPDNAKKYWFSAKTFGWGWGLPTAWQGWLVYGITAALLIAGPFLFSVRDQPWHFQAYIWGVVLVLLAICWIKGEPPRWRWGK
jgi:hypothetical protein